MCIIISCCFNEENKERAGASMQVKSHAHKRVGAEKRLPFFNQSDTDRLRSGRL